MPTKVMPRHGSLQFYPRKKAAKFLHRINFSPISSENTGLLGFIAYKAGMASVLVKDNTEKVQTSNKQKVVPATILEVPNMKIFSARFLKNKKPIKDIIISNDKELKRKLKVPKSLQTLDKLPEGYDDIHVIAYSLPKQTSIKKTPDFIELAIQATDTNAKLEFIKSLVGKEITLEKFASSELLDVRALTKGKGTQGPVKRFGITLRSHKAEKGPRKVGSIGPWHPATVSFRVPMAGQLGLFSRIVYNLKLLDKGSIKDNNINPIAGFKNYGNIKSSYLILTGSIPGPSKRQLVLTPSFRPTKSQSKKKYEFIEVLK